MALPSSRQVSPRSTADAGGLEVLGLDPTLLPKALAIRDWLLTEAAQLADPGQILPGLAERLIALGIPIDRIMSVIDLLHSEYAGVGRFWTKEEGTTSRLFPHGPNRDRVYNESPFAHVHRTREWLLLDLAQTPDSRFNIIPDLKAAGYRHYLVVPIFFTNGTHHGLTFATRAPDGFGEQGLRVLRFVMPTIAAMMEIRSSITASTRCCASTSAMSPTGPFCPAPSGGARSAASARPSCSRTCGTTLG